MERVKMINLTSEAYLENETKVPVIKFRKFDGIKEISCGFSTRLGGVSSGIYESLNLGFNRGDDRELVMENYRRLGEVLFFDEKKLVFPDQTHKANVRRVTKENCGAGIMRDKDCSEIDAQITNEKDVPIIVFASDCVPIFLYDQKKKAVAGIHAGWRGTVAQIPVNTVEAMQKEFGSNPEDIIAVIGPSAGKECYEVDGNVADEFIKVFGEEVVSPKENGKYLVDMWASNRLSLKKAGVKDENISISGICTICSKVPKLHLEIAEKENKPLLFSHRETHGQRGSNAGIIVLR
ncbi:MAG: peptidoglycan editing factor PgeF [Lachnospiraceae bacterium]|nr:peptidoglycan editing factor PgeF [Lachnospiraceae bacterium]